MAITRILNTEDIKDFQYVSTSQIKLPASSILIGTANRQDDAQLFTASELTFDFANGTGDNGLDTGTELQDQWYALYAVQKPGTTNYILKASVNPPPQAGGSGPTGFAKYRYLGLFKNGTNHYDTASPAGRGDIVKFTKHKSLMQWQSYSGTNGGLYPSVGGILQGILLYVANSSVDGVVMDFANAGNFGFAGFNVSGGGPKLPYRFAQYELENSINANQLSDVRIEDGSGNIRSLFPNSPSRNGLPYVGRFWYAYYGDSFNTRISLYTNSNANVSRAVAIRAMIDPYL